MPKAYNFIDIDSMCLGKYILYKNENVTIQK